MRKDLILIDTQSSHSYFFIVIHVFKLIHLLTKCTLNVWVDLFQTPPVPSSLSDDVIVSSFTSRPRIQTFSQDNPSNASVALHVHSVRRGAVLVHARIALVLERGLSQSLNTFSTFLHALSLALHPEPILLYWRYIAFLKQWGTAVL